MPLFGDETGIVFLVFYKRLKLMRRGAGCMGLKREFINTLFVASPCKLKLPFIYLDSTSKWVVAGF